MKTIQILLMIIFVLNLIGCDKEEPNIDKNITMTSISYTGCNTDTKSTDSNIPSIRITGQAGDRLLISLNNTEFCCGTDSITINKNIVHNMIGIEIIDNGPFTYCYCPHDLEFSIGPFNNENYVLTFIESEHAYSRDTFVVNFNYSQQLDTIIVGDYTSNLTSSNPLLSEVYLPTVVGS